MRVVTVTPAGRRRYTPILAKHLLRHRHVIDEHHWWACTRDKNDLAHLQALTAENADFFRINDQPYYGDRSLMSNIWKFFKDYTDPDTIYIRLDDDICYIAPDAIANLVRFRQENPEPFLVLGNIVNNSVCTHFHQKAGLLPMDSSLTPNECNYPEGLRSSPYARVIHRSFLRDVDRNRIDRWQDMPIDHKGDELFSINVICWRGQDMGAIAELEQKHVEEEPFLTIELPRRLKRPNVVCPSALFSHYAFYWQRDHLEWTARGLLARYARLAEGSARPLTNWDWWKSDTLWRIRHALWQVSSPIRRLRKLWHSRAVVRRTRRSEGDVAADLMKENLADRQAAIRAADRAKKNAA